MGRINIVTIVTMILILINTTIINRLCQFIFLAGFVPHALNIWYFLKKFKYYPFEPDSDDFLEDLP